MSRRKRSGLSIRFVVEFQVWNSITFICAAPTSVSALAISSIAGWPGQYSRGSWMMPGILIFSPCFWKKSSPPMP